MTFAPQMNAALVLPIFVAVAPCSFSYSCEMWPIKIWRHPISDCEYMASWYAWAYFMVLTSPSSSQSVIVLHSTSRRPGLVSSYANLANVFWKDET